MTFLSICGKIIKRTEEGEKLKARIDAESVSIDYGEKNSAIIVLVDGQEVMILEGKGAQQAIGVLRTALEKRNAERKPFWSRNELLFRNRIPELVDMILAYAGMRPILGTPTILAELLA